LQGTVTEPAVEGDSVDLLVFWSFYPGQLDEEPPSMMPAERVQVAGSFPSAFKLGTIAPPPDFDHRRLRSPRRAI